MIIGNFVNWIIMIIIIAFSAYLLSLLVRAIKAYIDKWH